MTDSLRVIYLVINLLGIIYSVLSLIRGVKIYPNMGAGVVPVCVKYFIESKQRNKRSKTLCLAAVSTKMVRYSERKEARHLLSGERY